MKLWFYVGFAEYVQSPTEEELLLTRSGIYINGLEKVESDFVPEVSIQQILNNQINRLMNMQRAIPLTGLNQNRVSPSTNN